MSPYEESAKNVTNALLVFFVFMAAFVVIDLLLYGSLAIITVLLLLPSNIDLPPDSGLINYFHFFFTIISMVLAFSAARLFWFRPPTGKETDGTLRPLPEKPRSIAGRVIEGLIKSSIILIVSLGISIAGNIVVLSVGGIIIEGEQFILQCLIFFGSLLYNTLVLFIVILLGKNLVRMSLKS